MRRVATALTLILATAVLLSALAIGAWRSGDSGDAGEPAASSSRPTATRPPDTGPRPTLGPIDITAPSPAGIFYVDASHPDASDSNPGDSQDAPWRTVVYAAATVRAGQTVNVKRGVYDDGPIRILHSGEAGAPIVLRAAPGDERQVEIRRSGIVSEGNSHIQIRGFFVTDSEREGIRVEGPADPDAPPATDIVIVGNHTYDTCSSGIAVWGVDWGDDPGDYDNIRNVVIEDNLVELGTNGCRNEIITVANGAVNVDVRFNTIRLGDPRREGGDEGIDFKEGVRDSRIHGNEIYDLSDKAIYIDGGSGPQGPLVTGIEISGNHMYDLPSAGVSITTEGPGNVDGVDVFNNVVHDVEGDGLLVYGHLDGLDAGGTVRNIRIFNNTVWNAGQRHDGHGGIRVNHPTASGVLVRNNVAWANNGYDILGEAETTIDHNLCRERLCEVRDEPRFTDPVSGAFALRPGSPAIDVGDPATAPATDHDGAARPQGGGPDLGALETP